MAFFFFFFFLVFVATGGSRSAFGGSVAISGSCSTDDGSGYAEVVAAAVVGLVTGGSVGSLRLILFNIIRAEYIRSSMP